MVRTRSAPRLPAAEHSVEPIAGLDALGEAFATLRTPAEVQRFLRDLCTPAELQALADRWSVVGLLRQQLPYREIHRQTGVSVTTIGRVARYLDNGHGGYALAWRRLTER